MSSLKKLERHPAVVRMDYIRDLIENAKRLFKPIAHKMVVTVTDDYIQIMMFPKKGELDWVGEEPIVTDVEGF